MAAAVRFRPPHAVAGCETKLAITAVGLVQGVAYSLVVFVKRADDVIYADETSLTWSREMAAASGDSTDTHGFEFMLPPLTAGSHTVRATLLDAYTGEELASMVQQLLPTVDHVHRRQELLRKWRHEQKQYRASAGTDGNEQLDIGRTIAILLSGLSKPITSTRVLPSIVENIIKPLGRKNVHFFVHTSPGNCSKAEMLAHPKDACCDDTEGTASHCGWPPWAAVSSGRNAGAEKTAALVSMYRDSLNESLRGIVVEEDYRGSNWMLSPQWMLSPRIKLDVVPSADVNSSSTRKLQWVLQFERLRDLYALVLAEEQRMMQRYSHVIRMRTDSTWLSAWKETEALHKLVPPRDYVVAFSNPHHHSGEPYIPDFFWIASRAAAKSTMVDFADSLPLPVDRKEIYDFFGCPWDPTGSARRKQTARDPCFKSVLGPNSIWPEVLCKMFMMRRFRIADSCTLTGPFRHSGQNMAGNLYCP